MLLWVLMKERKNECMMDIYCHTCIESCEVEVATCRCDLKYSTEHSSDCGSVATEFLKISELYRHNCACGSDW